MDKDQKDTLYDVEEKESKLKERIDRLYGVTEPEKPKRSEMSDEEKKQIKKQMVIGIWAVLIIFGVMVWNFFNPFSFGPSKDVEIEPSNNEPTLVDLPDGDVDINNKEIQKIDKMFSFNVFNPLYESQILNLYNGEASVEKLDFKTIMLLLTSNDEFNNFVFTATNLKNFNPSADINTNITLSTEELDSIAKKILGDNIRLEHQNFSYYYGTDQVLYFDVVLNEGIYTFNFIDKKVKSNTTVHSKLVSAFKTDDVISVSYQVLFANSSGIYSDSKMTNYLTNDLSKVEDFFNKAIEYNFTYKRVINENKKKFEYYLTNINVSAFAENIGG